MNTVPAAPAQPGGGTFRWLVCGLLFCSVAVNYVHRLVIGILKRPLSEQFGWSDSDYGNIAAAFSFAYAFGYLFGGRLLDRFGAKRGLPAFVLLWSLAAMAHGLCGLIGIEQQFRATYPWFARAEKGIIWVTLTMPMTAVGFVLARIALGLAQGGNFPGAIKVVAEWFPVKERALATGLFNAGTNTGAILCPIAVPWLFQCVGWEATFYLTGATGFLWVIAWWLLYDSPDRHRSLSPGERAYIRDGQAAVADRPTKVPWLSLFGHRAVWAFVLSNMLASPAWGFYQFFLPDFLGRRFNLSLQATGWWTGLFFALAAVGGVAGGWLAGWLLGRGWSLNAARKASLLVCALAVVPVFLAPSAGSVWLAVLIVGLAGSAHQGWSANLYSVVSDTMPREAISSVVGLGGFMAYFAGGFVNGITGQVLERTGSYLPVFAYFSGMYVLSLLAIQLLVPKIASPSQATPRPAS